jgi:signal transduction histidine kinase
MQIGIDDRGIKVSSEGVTQEIAVDRRLVRLAIKQILDNALKYSNPRTPIEVRVQRADSSIAIEITDFGPGIPAEDRQRIFERFYRGPSVKESIPGSGLGLSIANSIVTAHKGELTVKSRTGETTFRMVLPLGSEGGSN